MGTVKIEKTLIDAEGNVEKKEITSYKKETKEDDFVKMYVNELAMLRGIQAKEKDVLNELLRRMGYDNKVALPVGVKEDICNDLNIKRRHKVDQKTGEVDFSNLDEKGDPKPSVNALNVMLTRLCTAEVIKKVGKGVYEVNPKLFGKGTWSGVKTIRQKTIWDKEGKKTITAFDKIVNQRLGNE
jgi:hypothetical protein